MIASLMFLIAEMSILSCATRLSLKPGSGAIIQPIIGPMMDQIHGINTPVVKRSQVQPSIVPALLPNASEMTFPSLVSTASAVDTSEQMFAPPQFLEDWAMRNFQKASSTELLDASLEPSSTESGRELKSAGIDTVKSLELNSFLGNWNQMYGSVSSTMVSNYFGFDSPPLVSEYTLAEDGTTLDVLLQVTGPGGTITKASARAKATDLQGERKMSFTKYTSGTNQVGPPDFEGEYYIYKLGPIKKERYQYAIVGLPMESKLGVPQTQLLVLARDRDDFSSKYNNEVQEWLDNNFGKLKKARRLAATAAEDLKNVK